MDFIYDWIPLSNNLEHHVQYTDPNSSSCRLVLALEKESKDNGYEALNSAT